MRCCGAGWKEPGPQGGSTSGPVSPGTVGKGLPRGRIGTLGTYECSQPLPSMLPMHARGTEPESRKEHHLEQPAMLLAPTTTDGLCLSSLLPALPIPLG